MNPNEQEPAPFPYRPPSFHLYAVQAVNLSSGSRTDKILQNTYCLLAAMKGQGMITVDGIRQPLFSGKCYVLAPCTIMELEAVEPIDLDVYRVYFEAGAPSQSSCSRETVGELLSTGELTFQPFWRLTEFLEDIYCNRYSDCALESFRRNVRFQELIASLVEQNRAVEPKADALQAVERTIAYMHRCYHENISIEQLVQEAGISRWQYNALFKSLTGTTPIDYLTELRINRAKSLLLLPGLQLRDVSAGAGFRDEYYFSRRFKQTVGISPKQYTQANARPPRIVSLQYLGELLSLGIKPVGTNRSLLKPFHREAGGVHGIEEPPDAESMLKLKPDLILFPSFAPKPLVEQFAKVAPAVEVNWHDDVFARLTKIGELLGRRKEARNWISRYAAKAKRTRQLLAPYVHAGETVAAFIYDGVHRKLFVYGAHNFGHTLYRALHFDAPDKVKMLMGQHKSFRWTAIDPESVADYAADRIFLAVTEDETAIQWARAFVTSEHWRKLPAVRNGRAYIVEHKWGLYDPITLESHLDEMVRLLGT
ncbi:AraC family transcriptional regulator [Paenibacillus mesophilus]|uniref:AraC family transcriptional regulator n=1 Tax=Paenibacillus mesophilus TaxID=2582849 RepID=UPI00130540AF|nr:AraC family transcriptional regulator [Paenibacillus mesophilus]